MVIESARNLAGLEGANSPEFDERRPHPVIATMADQRDVVAGERDMGGTMRLGLYPATLRRGLARRARSYGATVRRGAAPAPLRGQQRLPRRSSRQAGLVFSGTSPDGRLVEFVELPRDVHPYFVGHPGAPGVPVAPDPGAPAVRRPGRRRAGRVSGVVGRRA